MKAEAILGKPSINLSKDDYDDEERSTEPLLHNDEYHLHYLHRGERIHELHVSPDIYQALVIEDYSESRDISIEFPQANEPNEDRSCRFCFDDHDNHSNPLIAPCRCSGSVKWVHRDCLDEFRSKSMNRSHLVRCSMCKQPFVLERHDEKVEDLRRVHKTKIAKDILLFFSGFLAVILAFVVAVGIVNWEWFPMAPYLPSFWTQGGGRILWSLLMGVAVFFASFAIFVLFLLMLRCCVKNMDGCGDCFFMEYYMCWLFLTPAPPPPPMTAAPTGSSCCTNCGGCGNTTCTGCSGGGGDCGGDCGGEGALVVLLIIFILLVVIGVIAFLIVSFLVISEACRRHVIILEHRSLAQVYPVKDLSSSEFVI